VHHSTQLHGFPISRLALWHRPVSCPLAFVDKKASLLTVLLFFFFFFYLCVDPVDDLSVYFSSLHPYLQATPMFQEGPISSTAVAWASYPPSLVDSNLVVDQFLGTIEAKLDEQSDSTDTTAHIPTTSMEGVAPNDTTGAKGIVSSAFGSRLSGPTKMYLTSVLRKRRIKMKKHKYKKLRKRTRALRKKLGK